MAPCIVEPSRIAAPRAKLIARLLAFLPKMRVSGWKLDLEMMPDRVKRDLGFLDGREPRYEDERRR